MSTSRRPARRQSALADEHPAYPAAAPAPAPAPSEVPAPTASPDATPPPPRRRKAPAKVQLNTRVPAELHERLSRFVDAHDSTVQDVVEAALTEYLDRRTASSGAASSPPFSAELVDAPHPLAR